MSILLGTIISHFISSDTHSVDPAQANATEYEKLVQNPCHGLVIEGKNKYKQIK